MKQKLKLLLLFICTFSMWQIKAQTTYTTSAGAENWACGLDSSIMTQLANDTGFIGRMARYNYALNNPPNSPQSGGPYIVPVVFHLLGSTPPTISYNQIKWQLALINAAFQKQMNLFNGQPNGPRAVNTQIEFRLACVAQNSVNAFTNASEPGVMRYGGVSSTVQNQITLSPTTFNPMLAITHPAAYPTTFPFANYLNIWCVPTIDGGSTIGYGTFPWTNAGIDGVVMDIDVIGNNSYPTGFPLMTQLDKGNILVHEIGHYLGLYHTFQPQTAGCTASPVLTGPLNCYGTTVGSATCEGDLILDTPPTKIASDLGGITAINTCEETNFPYGGSSQDQPDQLENYMSYSDDDRMNTFTQGQANRMVSSFTTTAYGNRFNLNNPSNLIGTGVYANNCSNLTSLLTPMFNYSISSTSGCTGANVQFIVPTSLGITTSGTTYNWNFGDSQTGTGINPIHSYSAPPYNFTATLTVINGTTTLTFTRTVVVPSGQSKIVSQSGAGIKVCKGSEQTIFVRFANNVPSAQITDGTNVYTVNNNYYPWSIPSSSATQDVPFTLTLNNVGVTTFSMVPASCGTLNLGSATFTVTECCSNIIANGDLEAGNTSFYSDHCMPINNKTAAPGTEAVNFDNLVYSGGPVNVTPSGKIIFVDGCVNSPNSSCNNSTNTVPVYCSNPGVRKVFFGQTVTGLQPNTEYYVAFKTMEHVSAYYSNCNLLNVGVRLFNSSSNLLTQNNLVPAIINDLGAVNNKKTYWHVFSFNFTTGNISPTTTYTFEAYQMDNFAAGAYDYGVDNFLLQALTPAVQAVGTTTICQGATAALTATANCGVSLANYNFAWTPTVGLSSPNTMATNATPSVTTIYTLVATPTSTVGSPPAIISLVTVTVRPSFTVSPSNTIIYAGTCTTLTATGNTGPFTWMPGALTGTSVVVCPTVTTVYTATSAATGTCPANNTATVIVSTACSQSATASYNDLNFVAGTYNASGQILDLSGTITFTNNTTFIGYTLRMAPGTLLRVTEPNVLTLDNCKLYGCTELWQGIKLITVGSRYASIDVKNGTTIEDMYLGIYRNVTYTDSPTPTGQGFINITDSKLNKNYIGVQVMNEPAITVAGTTYSLTVKNSTLTTVSSLTSPGNNLKPSTIPSYTYAYNQIASGTTGTTPAYTSFPRSFIGINLYNLSTSNNIVIGDSAGATGTFNTFSNLDIGINVVNAHLQVHNNYFYNLKGSSKQEASIINPPVVAGPSNIGVAVVASHTVANTYSLQVGTKNGVSPAASLAYPKSNSFKTVGKGVLATNCSVLISKGNYFEGDTTDVPISLLPVYPNTYYYYKSQQAIWSSGLGKGANLSYNWVKNFANGIYSSHSLASSTGASILITNNTVQVPSAMGYCRQAIEIAQVGGANMASNLLEVRFNTITKPYNGIKANAVLGGLYIHDNTNLQLDGAKTFGYITPNFQHRGIDIMSCQNAVITKNANINSTATITSSNYANFTGVYLNASPNNTVTCNSVNNVGRGFLFQGNCANPNSWFGNGINNSYQGLCLVVSGVMGIQGTANTLLAANTWSNVVQETYVSATTNANTASKMYVSANGTYTTSPLLNFAVTPAQVYVNAPITGGIDQQTAGTSFDCAAGGGTNNPIGRIINTNSSITYLNEILYSDLATSTNSVYPLFAEEFIYQNQQLVYKLQKQGVLSTTANSQLQKSYAANRSSNIGKFTDIEMDIATSNNSLALRKNNSIVPVNTVQQKIKRVNELMLKRNINCNYQYSSDELRDLESMANECEVKGWYVTQSRNIINAMSGNLVHFTDECGDTQDNAKIATEEENIVPITEPKRAFNLFPNPNNGNMTLSYDLGKDTDASMYLYDVTGKLINMYSLQNTTGVIEINEAQLQNGIYFYSILVNGNKINTNKIVIIK